MKKISTLILLAAIALSAQANKPQQDSLQLRNTTTHYVKDQIDIALSYPQLYCAPQTSDTVKRLATAINSDVCQMIASIAPAPDVMSKDSLWRTATSTELMELYLLGAATATVDDMARYGGQMAYQLYSDWTAFGNQYLVSIFMRTYIYTGGAHGMTIGRILNYNTRTGQRLDLVKEIEDTAFLMDLAAIYFCKERRLPKNTIKLNTGLFYELADLPFADQIGFTSKGMILYYDPYSIAPYSFGPIVITIPYKELDDVLEDNFYKLHITAGGAKNYNEKTKGKVKK